MGIILARTSRLKSNFIPAKYMPDPTASILQSVQIAIPQQSLNAIKQVRTRNIIGSYRFNERPATVSFSWLTSREAADALFNEYLKLFQAKTNGVVTDPNIPVDTFSYVSTISKRVSGLNPVQLDIDLTFLNCPDIYSNGFDPIEFFIDTESESEVIIKIEECEDDSLVIETGASITMRGDFDYELLGYRSLKFSEAILSESVTSIDSDYIPTWQYDEFVVQETSTESHNRNLGTQGPRTYTTSRQAHLAASGDEIQVGLGWL